ncbi:MAG: PqqD family protein [Planctomycetes bacterium]|nr:PqqD family protein [Planctomycetota bacterium]
MKSESIPSWTQRRAPFTMPPRRDDVVEDVLDDEVILTDSRTGNAIRLNKTALGVWRQCDGQTNNRQAAQRQTEHYEVDFDTALDHVEQLVVSFARWQLLDGSSAGLFGMRGHE